nr:hypothetical protein [Tanacetum cinerariifolium]
MMIYLRNMAGFKMDYFKGMSYDVIRPIFEKYFNSNVAFLEKTKEQMEEEDSKALNRASKSQAEKAVKKQKLDEEVVELKKHLQIMLNDEDDVYTEATPLARKVPVVDYEIYTENNKPYYKIIRADGSPRLFLSFLSLLRNFDREDLEVLWQLVKERFASSKPKNFSNDFLLTTLTYMFEKPDDQAQVWKNQRTVYGLAKDVPGCLFVVGVSGGGSGSGGVEGKRGEVGLWRVGGKGVKREEKRIEEEQAAKAQNWKFPVCYDDDDDEEGYNSLDDNIIFELPPYSAVTPTEPIDFLNMGDEHLNTIPATESDEFIKSCVENLVPNPSESEGENECDVSAGFTTFSNILFDDDYDSDSSDDQDILILEELLDNYSLSLPDSESYHFDIPSPYRPPAKPPDGNTGTLNIKMLGDSSDQKVPIPNLTITRVSNQEKSPDLLSHLGFKAFQPSAKCPMIINEMNIPLLDVTLFHFYPLDQLKYGGN